MTDMREFGKMNIEDRGGKHDFTYGDEAKTPPSNGPTPSQTVGPFFAYGLTPGAYGYPLKEIHATKQRADYSHATAIKIEGNIFDGNGEPVKDAIIEIVQANANGAYLEQADNQGFTGYLRAGTGANAEQVGFVFETVKPAPTGKGAAPFLTVIITMRGLLNHCITRLYFAGDDHSGDVVMAQVPRERQHTLIAKQISENHFRFDIHMQGENETVFFNL